MVSYVESMDGPVVKAAETALDMENINYILSFVGSEDAGELKDWLISGFLKQRFVYIG